MAAQSGWLRDSVDGVLDLMLAAEQAQVTRPQLSLSGPPRSMETAPAAIDGTRCNAPREARLSEAQTGWIIAVTGIDARNRAWRLLNELARLLDPARDDFDHQLINIDITLTTAEGNIANLADRVSEASGRLEVSDEDF
jgi:hypothetical protein